MPRKIVVSVTCDICGNETNDSPSVLKLNRQEVETDLCAEHRTELANAVEQFLKNGHKPAKATPAPKPTRTSKPQAIDPAKEGDLPARDDEGFMHCEDHLDFQTKSAAGFRLHQTRIHKTQPKTQPKKRASRRRGQAA